MDPSPFASELPPWELQSIVRELALRAKIPVPGFSINPKMRTGAGLIFHEMPLINLNPQELQTLDWTVPELKGILAHEIGHVALGHVFNMHLWSPAENWAREFAADDFAAKIGLGAELRSGLSAYIRWHNLTQKGPELFQPSGTHPPLPTRIQRLPELRPEL